MNILLVYPHFPTTYWGFQYSMPIAGKRASLPPLGLITLAALLPRHWPLRLVDLNIAELTDDDILWADAVLVGGMRIQAASIHEVIARARALGRRTVVGGPAPTTSPGEFADADVIFQGEAEGRIDSLVAALQAPAGEVRRLRAPEQRPGLTELPVPRFDLLDLGQYTSMSIQYSRGCPFSCEFCDIIEIFGRQPRLKQPAQIIGELQALRRLGFRGSVFLVDDNFIGNRVAVRALLDELTAWQRQQGYPFELYTEASVNLAADPQLVKSMTQAGFASVFLGIETPSKAALAAAGKKQNVAFDLHEAVERLTRAGLEVMGGFIVGFDQDDEDCFAAQREFIESAGIPLAMVGMLTALPGTALWRRMQREGRLRGSSSGDPFGRPNFAPHMDEAKLLRGYATLLEQLYTPRAYYRRCAQFVEHAASLPGAKKVTLYHLATLLRAIVRIGIRAPHRREFWRLIARAALRAPHNIPWSVGHAVMGEHMIRYTRQDVLPRIRAALAELEREQQRSQKMAPANDRVAADSASAARMASP